jgi:hypothetical protein
MITRESPTNILPRQKSLLRASSGLLRAIKEQNLAIKEQNVAIKDGVQELQMTQKSRRWVYLTSVDYTEGGDRPSHTRHPSLDIPIEFYS